MRRPYTIQIELRGRRFTVAWGSSTTGDFISKISEHGSRRASGRERDAHSQVDGRIPTTTTKFDASWRTSDHRRKRLQDEFYRSLVKAADAKRNAP